jgi:GrpB-like predicted nucleotidyltransferase (UPF0157 family)
VAGDAGAWSGEEALRRATVGEPTRVEGPVTLVDYDAAWPARFAREAARIRGALGGRALLVEHVGSTSVPGLVAKPIIDVVLAVADSSDEAAYVPALERAGYALRIREPEWHQHRMLRGRDPDVNLHVFTIGSPEVGRMLAFRERLRAVEEDRRRYAAAKRSLARREWRYLQEYADAKTAVVQEILARATAAGAGG